MAYPLAASENFVHRSGTGRFETKRHFENDLEGTPQRYKILEWKYEVDGLSFDIGPTGGRLKWAY